MRAITLIVAVLTANAAGAQTTRAWCVNFIAAAGNPYVAPEGRQAYLEIARANNCFALITPPQESPVPEPKIHDPAACKEAAKSPGSWAKNLVCP
jgi:hypothetical protein